MISFISTRPIITNQNAKISFKSNPCTKIIKATDTFVKAASNVKQDKSSAILEVLSQLMVNSSNREYAEILEGQGKKLISKYYYTIKNIFPNQILQGPLGDKHLIARVKDKSSIANKLNRISQNLIIKNYKEADEQIRDLVGVRLILQSGKSEEMDVVIDCIVKAIEKGKIKITEINNYRGPNSIPYLTQKQLDKIVIANARKGIQTSVYSGERGIKTSGYTAVQFNFGKYGELQIMGPGCLEANILEHQIYDVACKKYNSFNDKRKILYSRLKEVVEGMSAKEKESLKRYTAEYYKYQRLLELGENTQRPRLPAELNQIFDFENLNVLHKKSNTIK